MMEGRTEAGETEIEMVLEGVLSSELRSALVSIPPTAARKEFMGCCF